jgi:hypothetical protein
LKEVYALKASFTAENCRRITWEILDDGRAFFDDVKTTIDFTGPDMTFPQSYLIDILNNVRYAVPVKRASFPNEWRCREHAKDDKHQAKTPGGQGGQEHASKQSLLPRGAYGDGAGGPSKPNPYGQGGFGGAGPEGNQYGGLAYMEPFPRGGGGGQRDWRAGWNDNRNHKIKALMDPYLEWYNGRIHLAEVLDAAGKRQTDLPTLPRFCYANGRPFLCWNSTLGRCMYRECCYLREGGHPGPNNIPDDFAEKVCAVISRGIQARMQPGGGDGSPGTKLKMEPVAQAWQTTGHTEHSRGNEGREQLRQHGVMNIYQRKVAVLGPLSCAWAAKMEKQH